MQLHLDPSWKKQLQPEFEKPYFKSLMNFVEEAYANYQCYPKIENIFTAFNLCPFDKIKVVIIGQDPYHGQGQAHGLCFSVDEGVKHPPSLRNIFKEMEEDVNKTYPLSGNLESWARQGVLMLNATLTVQEGKAGSHQKKGWETFTNKVIEVISEEKTDIVFLLWGSHAHKKSKLINERKHHILTAGHPSPLSANRGYWFGNKCFSKTNSLLEKAGEVPIAW